MWWYVKLTLKTTHYSEEWCLLHQNSILAARYSIKCSILMIFGKGETSFHVRESETVLDPGFHTVHFGFQVMDLQSF